MGLRPIGNGVGGTAPQITHYTRSNTAVLYEGAILVRAADGPAVYNGTTAAHAYNVVGVCAAYCAADETQVIVYDDPQQEFLVQGDDAIADPIDAIGKMAPVSPFTGNTTTLQSKTEMTSAGITVTYAAFDCLQIRRIWNGEDNDQDAANAKWVVKFTPTAHILAQSSTRL